MHSSRRPACPQAARCLAPDRVRRLALPLGALLIATLAAAPAMGEPLPTEKPEPLPTAKAASLPAAKADPVAAAVVHERRGGFSAGLALGGVLGTMSGYPNDAILIDRPEFLTESGALGGGALGVWLGIAFTDWLALGLEGYGGRGSSSDLSASHAAFAFRLEGYPAYALGGVYRDLGASLEAGLGSTNATRNGTEALAIESGTASRAAIGVFYDGLRFSKLSMGPFAAADLMWSPSVSRSALWLGWRTSFSVRP